MRRARSGSMALDASRRSYVQRQRKSETHRALAVLETDARQILPLSSSQRTLSQEMRKARKSQERGSNGGMARAAIAKQTKSNNKDHLHELHKEGKRFRIPGWEANTYPLLTGEPERERLSGLTYCLLLLLSSPFCSPVDRGELISMAQTPLPSRRAHQGVLGSQCGAAAELY